MKNIVLDTPKGGNKSVEVDVGCMQTGRLRALKTLVKEHLRAAYWFFRPPIIDISGVKIQISSDLSVGMQNFLMMGTYEQEELAIVKQELTNNDCVMELGTGLGLLSAYCAKRIGSDKVFTYEANPMLQRSIRRTYELNNVSPNLNICILGEGLEKQEFHVHKDFWASSTIDTGSTTKRMMVETRSFADEVKRIDPTFLLIDIEGGEYDLLRNADFHNIRKIMIEFHEPVLGKEKTQAVRNQIAKCGFRPHEEVCTDQYGFYER